jgi:unsaturated chondroitin disaccharide hydrolase
LVILNEICQNDSIIMNNEILEFTLRKVEFSSDNFQNEFPHITVDGHWRTTHDGCWTGGFWVGILWLEYYITNDSKFFQWADKWTRLLERRKNDRTFDLGFLFYPSFVLGYRVTKDDYFRKTALEAANTLVTLYNENSNFIYNDAIVNEKTVSRTIIDIMMNLPLLWWAYEETGDEKYSRIAHNHSERTIKEFINNDYSTIQAIDFDLKSGKILKKFSLQGYSDGSCWARGQAWAIYGFVLAYKTSRDKRFLETAEKLAGFFIRNLPDDYVPYWDFHDPRIPHSIKDTSAAAISCSAFLTLSELSEKEVYKDIALKILNSLSRNYLAENSNSILKDGCYHKKNKGLIWGDYYFVESLVKAGIIDIRKSKTVKYG